MRFRYLPDTLAGRIFVILVGGVLLAASLTYALVQHERSLELAAYRQRTDAERLASMIRLVDALPAGARSAAQQAMDRQRMRISFEPPDASPEGAPAPAVAEALATILGGERPLALARLGIEPCRLEARADAQVPRSIECRITVYRVHTRLHDGTPLRLDAFLRVMQPEPVLMRPYALALFLGLLVASVLIAVRVATRPLRRLEQAAEALGRNFDRPPLDETGPRELQLAARTFNAMQAHIRDYVAERTHMLAAITHDLKTPLTRMRLRIEQVAQAPLQAKLAQDVAGMLALIDDGLALARSIDDGLPMVEVELRSLVDSVCADAREAGVDVRWESGLASAAPLRVAGRPDALRRALWNLIDNAAKYAGSVEVTMAVAQGAGKSQAEVRVRDHGPGIPERHLADVLKPFFRLEQSRSRTTGGSGLGLAIAANIARAHRGELALRNCADGGLEACIGLPVSEAAPAQRAAAPPGASPATPDPERLRAEAVDIRKSIRTESKEA